MMFLLRLFGIPCRHCGAIIDSHNYRCPNATKADIISTVEWQKTWIADKDAMIIFRDSQIRELNEKVEALKHENNKLRKRNERLTAIVKGEVSE